MRQISVAIDGPSGAGKSTLARAAAGELHYLYVDTGAIYRTIACGLRRLGVDPKDAAAAAAALGEAAGGEKSLSDALREAYSYAFSVASEDTETGGSAGQEQTPPSGGTEASDQEVAVDTVVSAPASSGDLIPTDGDTYGEAMVAAFSESQSAYADRELPANVTYEMPQLGIDGICPVSGCVSSGFGYRPHPSDGAVRFHYGTDIAADLGTPVVAFADGTVAAVGDSSGYGTYVLLDNGSGVRTMYAHLSAASVSAGQSVAKGDEIGAVGESGNATGPCLHFEILKDGEYVNPEYYVSWT